MVSPLNFTKLLDLIGEAFIDCVNESFDKEEMSNSQRQAVITLIEELHALREALRVGGAP